MRGGSTVATLAFCGMLFGGCVSQAKYLELEKKYVERERVISMLNAEADEAASAISRLEFAGKATESLLKKREEELALVSQVQSRFNEQMKQQIADIPTMFGKDDGVTVDRSTGALVLEGEVFFDSGSATIKESAKKTLLKVGKLLKNRGSPAQVVGHTDSDPLVKSAAQWKQGNLELSGARALNVLVFLNKEGGVPETLLSFAGCGPHKPRVDNNSDANKRMNRRVEILVLSPSSN
jgi:flagellar motor protein MotB